MKILSLITLTFLLNGCYGIIMPLKHHRDHDHPETHGHPTTKQLEMEIGGKLYVDELIR